MPFESNTPFWISSNEARDVLGWTLPKDDVAFYGGYFDDAGTFVQTDRWTRDDIQAVREAAGLPARPWYTVSY